MTLGDSYGYDYDGDDHPRDRTGYPYDDTLACAYGRCENEPDPASPDGLCHHHRADAEAGEPR